MLSWLVFKVPEDYHAKISWISTTEIGWVKLGHCGRTHTHTPKHAQHTHWSWLMRVQTVGINHQRFIKNVVLSMQNYWIITLNSMFIVFFLMSERSGWSCYILIGNTVAHIIPNIKRLLWCNIFRIHLL